MLLINSNRLNIMNQTDPLDPIFSFSKTKIGLQNPPIYLRKTSVSSRVLGRYFQFDAESLFIQEEFGYRVEFPDSNGKFDLEGFLDSTSFVVYGDDVSRATSTATLTSSSSVLGTAGATKPWIPAFSSKGKGPKKEVKTTVKVVFAEIGAKGRPETSVTGKQTFVPLYNDEQATVEYITSFVSKVFQESVVLVGNNGMKYEDEPGTRGISFWKKGSRKVFAVPNVNARKRKPISVDDSDDSDFDSLSGKASTKKQKQHKPDWETISNQLSAMETQLESLEQKVEETQSDVKKALTLSKDAKVPLAIKNIVKESFCCLICKNAPMQTPVIASRCCGAIIGCSTCVDTWYSTGSNIFNQTCPHCRGERAYSNTFRLNGLDDFLNKLREVCQEDNA